MQILNHIKNSDVVTGFKQVYHGDYRSGGGLLLRGSAKLTLYGVATAATVYGIYLATASTLNTFYTQTRCDDKYCYPLTTHLSKTCPASNKVKDIPELAPLQRKPADTVIMDDRILWHDGGEENAGWGFVEKFYRLIAIEKELKEKGQISTRINQLFRNYVRSMIKYGFNVNGDLLWQDTKPLHRAAHEGAKVVTQVLIDLGANVNETTSFGTTALHEAAQEGHLDVAKLLVGSGTHVNALYVPPWGEDKRYPLDRARSSEMIQFLMNSGAKSNIETLLEWNIRCPKDPSSVELLMKSSPPISAVQKALETANKISNTGFYHCGFTKLPDLQERMKKISSTLTDYLSHVTSNNSLSGTVTF